MAPPKGPLRPHRNWALAWGTAWWRHFRRLCPSSIGPTWPLVYNHLIPSLNLATLVTVRGGGLAVVVQRDTWWRYSACARWLPLPCWECQCPGGSANRAVWSSDVIDVVRYIIRAVRGRYRAFAIWRTSSFSPNTFKMALFDRFFILSGPL